MSYLRNHILQITAYIVNINVYTCLVALLLSTCLYGATYCVCEGAGGMGGGSPDKL